MSRSVPSPSSTPYVHHICRFHHHYFAQHPCQVNPRPRSALTALEHPIQILSSIVGYRLSSLDRRLQEGYRPSGRRARRSPSNRQGSTAREDRSYSLTPPQQVRTQGEHRPALRTLLFRRAGHTERDRRIYSRQYHHSSPPRLLRARGERPLPNLYRRLFPLAGETLLNATAIGLISAPLLSVSTTISVSESTSSTAHQTRRPVQDRELVCHRGRGLRVRAGTHPPRARPQSRTNSDCRHPNTARGS